MSRPDILIIKPGSQKQIYGELSAYKLTAIEPPLWAAIWASYLRDLGYAVELLDAELDNLSYQETAEYISNTKPILAVVMVSGTNPSASTMNMTGAGKILEITSEIAPGVRTMFGGLHPSALPERTMNEERCDFVCQGEGFYTLPRLIDALKSGLNYNFKTIAGLWWRDEKDIIGNSSAPLMENLDSLSMPAWDLLPLERYRAHNWHCFDRIEARQPYAVLYTSLGCPFKCSFCCINAFFGRNTIRYRDLDRVLNEIDYLVQKRGVRNIKIMDEMFAMNEKRVAALCDRIIQHGHDLNLWVYARVNTVTRPMLEKMKLAGVNWVAYGFESGSRRVIQDVAKGYRIEDVMKVVEMTYDIGMHICGNYIIGLPEDDYGSIRETIGLMLEINSEWANIYSAMAYPGSLLFDIAQKKGWPLPSTWECYSQYSYECLPLATNYLSGGQVLAFRDYAFNIYYDNPAYLSKVRRIFGENTFKHIVEMSKKHLQRKYLTV